MALLYVIGLRCSFRPIVNGDIGTVSQQIHVANFKSLYRQVGPLSEILQQLGVEAGLNRSSRS